MKNKNIFREILKGRVVIVGIGNILKGDDGAGVELIHSLSGVMNAVCIDAGTTPENYAGKIIREKPGTVLIVDAAHIGRPAHEYMIAGTDDIAAIGFTTHDMPATLLIKYITTQTSANVYMLAIQPADVSLGADMSNGMKEAIIRLSGLIREALDA